jgi:hypothetical protein
MPIRQGGILANRFSTWPRDHFCRSTMAPRASWPTTWNAFLPISMPITAHRNIGYLRHRVVIVCLRRPLPASLAGRAGAHHPINGSHPRGAVQSGSPRFVAFGALFRSLFLQFSRLGYLDCIVGPRASVASRASNLTLYSRFMRYSPQARAISVPSLEHDWG